MMTEVIKNPELRFPEFGDVFYKGTLIEISKGKLNNGVFNDPGKTGSGYYLINVKDMYSDLCIDKLKLTRLELDKNEFKRNKVEYGDVFFTRSSIVRTGIAYSAINLYDDNDITYDGHLIKLSPNIEIIDPKYLGYSLKTDFIRRQLVARGKTGTMTTIGQEDIASVIIYYPTVLEQKKVGSFLTAIDKRITLLTLKKEKLEQYKKGVMQGLFGGGGNDGELDDFRIDDNGGVCRDRAMPCLYAEIAEIAEIAANPSNPENAEIAKNPSTQRNPSGPSKPETPPNHNRPKNIRFKNNDGNDFPEWEEKRLGEILKIGSGRDYKHLQKGNIPVYGTGGYMTSVSDFLFEGSSVCIGRKGTIDKPMFLNGKFWTVDTLFYSHSFNGSIPKFVYYLFQGINWIKLNEASGVPSLSKTTIEKIKIKLPSLPEQQKIASFLSSLDAKIEKVTTQIEKTKRFKQGLLQKMFV